MSIDIPRLEDLPEAARAVGCCCAPTSTSRCATGGSRTTCASRRCCRRCSGCTSRARPSSRAGTSAGPKGKVDPQFSMAPVAARLGELLGREVALAPQVVGPTAASMAASLEPGDVMLLENLRFEAGRDREQPGARGRAERDGRRLRQRGVRRVAPRARVDRRPAGDPARAPAAACCSARSRCSRRCSHDPKQPFVAVLGGAKVSDKLGVIGALLDKCETILIGGAMAFTFLAAQGYEVGDSLLEPEWIADCKALLETGRVKVPVDVVIAQDIAADAPTRIVGASRIPDGWKGLDIGPETAAIFADTISGAANVLWNGPMGVFELEPFAAGTLAVAEAVADCHGFTVIGGGDSAAAIRQFGLADRVDHVSTGGGASLELIEQGDLPGLAALRNGKRD